MNSYNQNDQGFTLVELAIVLMIIGLLIGGVLRGQEMLANARTAAAVQQIKSYEGAVLNFRSMYNAIPGDLVNAELRIPGCNSSNSCVSGNGNSIIGSGAASEPWQVVSPAMTEENSQFWKHLALAHLISGVNAAASEPVLGVSHPLNKMEGGFSGGGYYVRFTNFNVSGYVPWTGHMIVTTRQFNSSTWVASPIRLAQLDQKMDDGKAFSGDARSISYNWADGCGRANAGINGPTGYAETSDVPSCRMAIKIF